MKNNDTLHHSLITEKVFTLSKVLPLVVPFHEDVRQVVLWDLRAPDADGVARGLHLPAALLQGPQLLTKVTRSVLEVFIICFIGTKTVDHITIRKSYCPTFNLTLIEQTLSNTERLLLRRESFSGINQHFTVETILNLIIVYSRHGWMIKVLSISHYKGQEYA